MKNINLSKIDKISKVIPKSTQYYHENKEKMRKYMTEYQRKKHQNVTIEQKEKVKEYQRNYRKNMSNGQKEKVKEYLKNYRKNMSKEQKEKLKESRKNYCKALSIILTNEQKEHINK